MRTQSLYTDAVLTDIPTAPHPRIHIHIQRRRCCDAYRFVYVYQMEIGTRGPRRGNTSFLGLNNNGTFLHSLSAIGIMRGCQYVFSFSLGHPQKFFHFLPILVATNFHSFNIVQTVQTKVFEFHSIPGKSNKLPHLWRIKKSMNKYSES